MVLGKIEELIEKWNDGKIEANKCLTKIFDLIQEFKDFGIGCDKCDEEIGEYNYSLYWDSKAKVFRCKDNPKHTESFEQATREFCDNPFCHFRDVVKRILE
jgi:ribonuclease BN (tRNA processing enzyme)